MMSEYRENKFIPLIQELFITRDDAYAEQVKSDNGCWYRAVREPITEELLHLHLIGEKTLGVYQGQYQTIWLCIDIDTRDKAELAQVIGRIKRLGIPYDVEDSGYKGRHVWIFFEQPIPNEKAIQIGKQIAGKHEVFPKQYRIAPGKLGSVIKLPLGKHKETEQRCLFLDENLKPYPDQYAFLYSIRKCDGEALWRRLCKSGPSRGERKTVTSTKQKGIKPCVQRLLATGISEGCRNQAGHIIACEYRQLGFNENETRAALSVWNLRNNPPLSGFELDVVLKSAFSKQYAYGCHMVGALRQVVECPGEENCRYHKVRNKEGGG